MGESKETTVFVVREKYMAPRCRLQLELELRPYTPSRNQSSDDVSKYAVETEIMMERWKSVKTARENEEYVQDVATDMGLRRRMKQTLSDVFRAWMRPARKQLFSLLAYDLTERQSKDEDGIELEKKLKSQIDEARASLRSDRENDLLCA